MIQVFKKTFYTYFKHKNKVILTLSAFFIITIIALISKFHFKDTDKIYSVLNNILQFSGIYSAILITFIVSKIFQIRQEKLERLQEIIVLSHKTTDFRRVCNIILETDDFWEAQMKDKLNTKLKDLHYFHIYIEEDSDNIEVKNLINQFYQEKNISGANFYLALKSFVQSDNNRFHMELSDEYDYNIIYSYEILKKWVGSEASNSFWYYLEYKWHDYKEIFDICSISRNDKEKIYSLAAKIDNNGNRTTEFNKDILVDLGNYLNFMVLPRLYQLTRINETGISKTLNLIIVNLVMVMIFGVFLPIIVTSIDLKLKVLITIAYFGILLLGMSMLYFVYYFRMFLKQEIIVDKNNA